MLKLSVPLENTWHLGSHLPSRLHRLDPEATLSVSSHYSSLRFSFKTSHLLPVGGEKGIGIRNRAEISEP